MFMNYKYTRYKHIAVYPEDNTPFVVSKKDNNHIFVAKNIDIVGYEFDSSFGPAFGTSENGVVFYHDINSTNRRTSSYLVHESDYYHVVFPWGYEEKINFIVRSGECVQYSSEIGGNRNGFFVLIENKGINICVYDNGNKRAAGFLIASNGTISFAKYERDANNVIEKKDTSLKLLSGHLPSIQKIRKPNKYLSEYSILFPLEFIQKNNEIYGKSIIATSTYDKGEHYRNNINQKYDKEGYAVVEKDFEHFKIGYLSEKNGKQNFLGPLFEKFFDGVDTNIIVSNVDNNLSNGYHCHKMSTVQNDLFISYYRNGIRENINLDIYAYDYINIGHVENGKDVSDYRIYLKDLSIENISTGKRYPNPFFFEEELIEEDEMIETNPEEDEAIETNPEEDGMIELLDELISETKDKNSDTKPKNKQMEAREDVNKEEQPVAVKQPKIKEKKPSLFDYISTLIKSFVSVLFFPFKWIASFFRKLKRKRRKYYGSPIRDFFENVWDAISSFFGTIFGVIGSFFVIVGKGILVGLSAILTGILFVPKMILKGLSAIGGGVKEASFGTVASLGAPLLSGICLLLVMFNCIIPINNWFSDLVSVHIFSWMGLHLCTLFLNAVGVNFFSVIGVIFIFFIDLIYNLLLILFELIMCILYLLVFFVGIYGVGVVALVLIILSYVFFARSKGSVAGVTLSMLISIGFLIPYYILLIQLWNSVS